MFAVCAFAQPAINGDFTRVSKAEGNDSVYYVRPVNNPNGVETVQITKGEAKNLVLPIFDALLGGLDSRFQEYVNNQSNMDFYERYFKRLFPNDPNIRQLSDSIVAPTFADTIKPNAYKGRFRVGNDTTMKFRTWLNNNGKLVLDFEQSGVSNVRATFKTSSFEIMFGTVNSPVPVVSSRVLARRERSDKTGFVYYKGALPDGTPITFKIPIKSNR